MIGFFGGVLGVFFVFFKNGIKTTMMALFSLAIQGEDLDFWLSTAPLPASTTQPQVDILPHHRKLFLMIAF